MCSSGIESRDRIAFFVRSERELCFITITKRMLHSNNRLHHCIDLVFCEPTDSFQIATNLLFFESKLTLIRHFLDLTATALSCKCTLRFYTICRRMDNLHHPGIAIIFLCFHHFRFYYIPDDRIFNKQGISIHAADSFTAHTNIRYFYCYNVIFIQHFISVPISILVESRFLN